MKPLHFKLLLATTLVAGLTIASTRAQNAPTFIPTANAVETRIGTLKFEQGFPTEETKNKVFDEIDYQRAVQTYLWAYPAVSFQSMMKPKLPWTPATTSTGAASP